MAESKISSHKNKLRSMIKQREKNLEAVKKAQWDENIFSHFLEVFDYLPEQEKTIVYCYVSCKKEADTRKILEYLWKQNIRTAVPRVQGKEMEFYEITSFFDLEPGYYGILEPVKSCPLVKAPKAVMIVPGAGFSPDKCRLGRGGGFYDRFFEKEPMHKKLAIAYEYQMFSQIPVEKHDVRMDLVITEKQIYF